MVSANTLFKKILNVKHVVIEGVDICQEDNIPRIVVKVRPTSRYANRCPYCGRVCVGYDQPTKHPRRWRALDICGAIVELEAHTHRIKCPEHGTLTADVPWAYPGSNFTKDFELVVAWFAAHLPRSVVSHYMRIDWKTVGRCVSRTLHEIEPERQHRLNGLVNIGIDETSYKKGHKYITVVVNHDTNTVVWAAEGHGKSVLTKFYNQLTEEQRAGIRVVTGDGARWITDCVEEFTPDCERCVDPFHVVQWAMDALDEVRLEAWRCAFKIAKMLAEAHPQKKGRPSEQDKEAAEVNAARKKASHIKGAAYTLGKAPENLSENQKQRLEIIANEDPRLYRAYQYKEALRLILKSDSVSEAAELLKSWLWKTSHSKIPAICELSKKVRRNMQHILNAIRYGMSNARVEAINNKIKLIIRKAYGFRNVQNMLDMVYLVCSNIRIQLPNRS